MNLQPPTHIFRCSTISMTCPDCNNLYQEHYSDIDITLDKGCINCINQRYAGRIFQKNLLSLNQDNSPKIYFGRKNDGSTNDISSGKYSGLPFKENETINCIKNILIRNNFQVDENDVFVSLDENHYQRIYFKNNDDLFIVKNIYHSEYPGIGLLNTREL